MGGCTLVSLGREQSSLEKFRNWGPLELQVFFFCEIIIMAQISTVLEIHETRLCKVQNDLLMSNTAMPTSADTICLCQQVPLALMSSQGNITFVISD